MQGNSFRGWIEFFGNINMQCCACGSGYFSRTVRVHGCLVNDFTSQWRSFSSCANLLLTYLISSGDMTLPTYTSKKFSWSVFGTCWIQIPAEAPNVRTGVPLIFSSPFRQMQREYINVMHYSSYHSRL